MIQEYKPGKWLFKHDCSANLKHNEGPFTSQTEAEQALKTHVENCHER